jgi:hypothetical protein
MRYLSAIVALGLWIGPSAASPGQEVEAPSAAQPRVTTVRTATAPRVNPRDAAAAHFIHERAALRAQQRHARIEYRHRTGQSAHRPSVSTDPYFQNLNPNPWLSWSGPRHW